MRMSIRTDNGGASGAPETFGPELGGYALVFEIDGKVMAVFKNDQFESFTRFWQDELVNSELGTEIDFDNAEDWIPEDFEWAEDDVRAGIAIGVELTREEFIERRTVVGPDHPFRKRHTDES